MNAGCYVGRIGGLAVALGVGAAVLTGQGVAYAESGSASDTPSGNAADNQAADAGKGSAKDADAGKGSAKGSGKWGSKGDGKGANKSDGKDGAKDTPSDTDTGDSKKDRHDLWHDLFNGLKPKPKPDPKPGTGTDDAGSTPADGADDGDDAAVDPADDSTAPKKPRWSWKPIHTKPAAGDAAPDPDKSDADSDSADEIVKPAKPGKNLLGAIFGVAPHTTKPASQLISVTTPKESATTTTPVDADEAADKTATVTAGPLATLFKQFLDVFSGNAPASPAANSPFAWLAAAVSRRELDKDAQAQDDPTMVWNGLKVVPVGKPVITSFYGKYTMVPAFPGVLQGTQDFDLVDPETDEVVGRINGLVAINNDLGSGTRSLQIVVLNVESRADGAVVGTKPGDIPPVGSIFASVSDGRNGTVYSALAQDGTDVVSYRYVSASGFSFPLNADLFFKKYSAADFLTDYVGANRPINTQDGYYIKPVTPNSMEFTGFTGYEPFFNAIQGTQRFGLYDKETNELIGEFDGVVTVTSDFWGTTSEAIIVTDTGSLPTGTAAGEIPPVGTVYNVIYWRDEFSYALYYSKPTASGKSVYDTLLVSKTLFGTKVDRLPLKLDASVEPVRESYDVGDYKFVPKGDLIYTGVNGLPPREVIVQGYQRFDVYDSDGNYIATVDADVSNQWDVSRGYSKAILVTDINGSDDADTPPVGSIFNFKYTGNTGFGEAYYSMPGADGDKIVYQLVTPFGRIPLLTNYNASKGIDGYQFYSPFGDAPEMNLLGAGAGESGGLLGANQPLCVLDSGECLAA